MNFTPSSSVSSSTTTTNSLTENFYRTKGNTFGCLSFVITRFLCSKTLQTYPSDPPEPDDEKQSVVNIEKIVDGSATPNLVARLMGLDSMPEIDLKTPQKGFNSIKRRKSMDAGDFRGETEEILVENHRRTKTAFSFRESSGYFELEDDDFLVLNFESKSKGSKHGNSHHKRREKCGRKQRKNRGEQGSDKNRGVCDENRLSLKISAQNLDINGEFQSQSYHISNLKEKEKEICLVDSKEDCDLENSSPVSVLDHREFINDLEVTTSEEDVKVRRSNPRNDSSEEVPCDESEVGHVEREKNGNEEREVKLKRKDLVCKKQENIQMVNRVCRLAEAEIFNNSNWHTRGMFTTQELEDAGSDFGQQIFDELVYELVIHLLLITS